jgi:hypothetical protein
MDEERIGSMCKRAHRPADSKTVRRLFIKITVSRGSAPVIP